MVSTASAIDRVTFDDGEQQRRETGRVLVQAQDGGMMFEGQDGQLWTLFPKQNPKLTRDEVPFTYLTRKQLTRNVLAELPDGFRVHETQNYLVFYDTSRAYAQWCGALFEQLQRAFMNFWRRKGLKLEQPRPLVAIIFRDRAGYVRYGQPELGSAADSVIGYYSLKTNRITTFDLTGLEQLRRPGDGGGSSRHIRRILARPAAEKTVATVIHEATHQIAFNSGLQQRFADNPLWLSEGLAIYFEAPDLGSNRGWSRIGSLHPARLETMRRYLPNRPQDSLFTLLTDDKRLREVSTAAEGYAESWALCYFLIRNHPKEFREYMKLISEKPVLGSDSAEVRVSDFERSFGVSWRQLDQQFMRSIPEWR